VRKNNKGQKFAKKIQESIKRKKAMVNFKKSFMIYLLILIALFLIPSLTLQPSDLPDQKTIMVKDLSGREVKVQTGVESIVCAGPGALRLIVYLNALEKVKGVEEVERLWGPSGRPYAIAHSDELKGLPSIGPGGPGNLPDLEALIALSPQVIFMTYVEPRIAQNIQSRTGIPVVVLSYGEHATFSQPLFESIMLAGKILGRERRAEELIGYIKACMADLKARTDNIAKSEKPSTYVGGIGYKGVHGIESTEIGFPPLEFVQANNVTNMLKGEGHVFIDKEKLLEWDPEVIFIDEGGLELVKQDYLKNKGFYISLRAFINKKVYGILPFNFYATNLDTALADAYYIGKVLYPQRFKDIEPEKKADEIYNFLVGKPVYSTMEKDFGDFLRIELE
jgi:iron complex transport system substrate-binding protein